MFRAAVFDLDGTFIDSTDAIIASFFHTFDALGEPRPPREVLTAGIGHVLEDQFALYTDTDPFHCTGIYRAYYGTICNEMTTLLPGARETVEQLTQAGLKLGFATSKQRAFAEQILDYLGVLDFFESRIGPGDVTHPKPHPECVQRSLDNLGVQPNECIFVGDTDFDVKACAAAGVPCIAVTTGYNTRAQLQALSPLAVLDDLHEVTDLILASTRGAVSP